MIHRLIFLAILSVWTWLLLKPNPVPTIIADNLIEDLKYILGKTLHMSAYAFLAFYGTWRMRPSRWKWLWLFLLLHGIAAEIGQYVGKHYFDTNRGGSVKDVFIDAAGIAVGAWLRFRSFRRSG